MSRNRNDVTVVLRQPPKNSSQKRPFEMPGGETEYVRQSTTHEAYRSHAPACTQIRLQDDMDRKRKELEEHLWKTMTEKVLNDLAAKAKSFCAQNNQFETTYSSTFQINGFNQKEIGEQLDEELCAKYPLYNTNCMSVPVNRYECERAKQSVHKNLADLFKKDNRFTSRMSDLNDYHAPVNSGHFAFV